MYETKNADSDFVFNIVKNNAVKACPKPWCDLLKGYPLTIQPSWFHKTSGVIDAGFTIKKNIISNPIPYIYISCTLWLFNIAMENGPFIVDLPIKNGDFPWLC